MIFRTVMAFIIAADAIGIAGVLFALIGGGLQ